ncbi:MAG: iron-sulfur cluster assembly scaffold protein [Candidatus Aminicenantes bacterium]|nr:iron-sulfur cluster assembly scaffold protein [Candidatus Aminicenantes bacterium]
MPKDKDLEEFARKLQEQIMQQARLEYTEEVIERWQNPKNFHSLENPDGYGKVKGTCGDTMEIFIRIEGDRISQCAFLTDGCAATLACGSMATEIAIGKSFTEALASVSGDMIMKRLGGLPEGNVHCAFLAAETLRRALADCLHQQRSGWKKLYRKNQN